MSAREQNSGETGIILYDDKVVQSGGMSHENSIRMNEAALAPDLPV